MSRQSPLFMAVLILLLLFPSCRKSPDTDVVQSLEERIVLLELKLKESEKRLSESITRLKTECTDKHMGDHQDQEASGSDAGQPEANGGQPVENLQEISSDPSRVSVADMYRNALKHYNSKQYPLARAGFTTIEKQFADHKLAANALYWLGEIEYSSHNYNNAILFFQQVGERYPDSNKAPDALLKLGKSRERLGQYEESRQEYRRVINRHPESNAASLARKWL